MFGIEKTTQHHTFFTKKGLMTIKSCPRCKSNIFNVLDYNTLFHCWECRLVCNVLELDGVILQ